MKFCFRTIAASGFLALLPVTGSANARAQGDATVAVLDEANWNELAPQGKEADAIYGDLVLVNQHLRAVIARPLQTRHANMTVRDVGGCLIDLSSIDGESDQLSAFYPGRKAFPFGEDFDLLVDGRPAEGVSSGRVVSVTVHSKGSENRPSCDVTYSLEAGVPYLRVTSIWKNGTAGDFEMTLGDDLRFDAGKERVSRQPNGSHPFYWMADEYWKQAYAVVPDDLSVSSNSGSRDVSLAYETADGADRKLAAGEELSLSRVIFPAPHSLEVIAQATAFLAGVTGGIPDSARHEISLTDASRNPIEGAVIRFTRMDGTSAGAVTTGENGKARTHFLQGYSITADVNGQSFEINSALIAGDDVFFSLVDYHRATVVADIRDGNGQPIPAKVEFIGRGVTKSPDFGPETAERFVGNLAYTPNGSFTKRLPGGTYDVIVSHGPEYDVDFTQLTVPDGGEVMLKSVLNRVVQTPGWVSADFHSHSSPSGDNTGSQVGRVLNLAAEQLEFAPCTEHNRVSSYDEHIARFGLKPYLATVTGIELTGQPLPLNHQNVFPLIHRPHTQDGGGPVTDASPETQIERVAFWDDRSEKLVQQNHPDMGWLFYDKNGDGVPDGGYSRAFELMHVIEVHPIDRMLKRERFDVRDGNAVQNNKMLNWLQLLNQGYRIWGVVNTDAHYNFHGSSSLRNWVQSPTDDPAEIDPMEIVRASKSGHVIMSNGPYLEFSVVGGEGPGPAVAGDDIAVKDGRVDVTVRVQCPNWVNIDTVFVLVNGRETDEFSFNAQDTPDLFPDGVVRFEKTVSLTLDHDAHLIAVTGHTVETLGDVVGPFWGGRHPTAVSNPVFVDVDGDGFSPNQDTLGYPLPVKFEATER